MRTRSTFVLILAVAAGCPSEVPPPPPPPPPPLPPCETLLQGRTARVENAPSGIPQERVATIGSVGDVQIGLGMAGNEFWVTGEDGTTTHFVVEGPDLPIGARFLAVLDWNLGSYQEPPVIPALLTEGHPEACLFDGREPIALEDATGLAAAPDANALAATLALRYLKTCPASPDECAVYGAPSAVESAEDPMEPPGGFFVRVRDPATAPEDLEYVSEALTERGEPGGASPIYRLVKSGNVSGWGVEVEHGSTEDGHGWARVNLKKRRTRVHAFDLDFRDDSPQLVAQLHVVGDNLVLWVAWPELGFTLSVHAKRDGARVGEPLVYGLSPYYDLGPNGIEGVALYPVLGGEAIGMALWDATLTDGVLYAGPDAEPEWMAVGEPGTQPEEGATPRFFAVTDGKLVPTF